MGRDSDDTISLFKFVGHVLWGLAVVELLIAMATGRELDNVSRET